MNTFWLKKTAVYKNPDTDPDNDPDDPDDPSTDPPDPNNG